MNYTVHGVPKSRTQWNDFHFLSKVMSTEKENQRKSGLASDMGHPSGAVAIEQWSLLTTVTSTAALQCPTAHPSVLRIPLFQSFPPLSMRLNCLHWKT